jgi:O-antigen/teichoic acid export membrane protein
LRSKDSTPPPAAQHGSYRSGFAFGILSFLTMAILGLGSTIVTARLYGVHIIGQFALVSAPTGALWYLSTAKEQAALIREITDLPPRHPRVTQLFAAVFTFSSGLTLAMALLGGVLAALVFRGPLHHPELVAPMLVSLAGYAIVTNTAWNFDSIFSAFVAGRELFWVRLHETFSFLTIAIIIGLSWHSIWGLVLGTIGGSLTSLFHRLVIVRPFVRARLSRAEYRLGLRSLPELLRFGLKITPGSIAQGISQQAGVWTLSAILPLAAVGAYSRAQTVPERLQLVNTRISEVLYPTLVGRRARGDGEGFDRALIDSIRYAMIGMLLIAAGCGGGAHSILELFGSGFSRATTALELLILYPALASITVTQNQALFAVNRPSLTSVITLIRLAVTIALTIVLAPKIGIMGPAVALLAGYAIDIILKTIVLTPFLSSPLRTLWPWRERCFLLTAYAGGFSATLAVSDQIPSVAGLLLGLLAGTIAYAAVLLVGGGINTRDRHRLRDVLSGARSRLKPNKPPRSTDTPEHAHL